MVPRLQCPFACAAGEGVMEMGGGLGGKLNVNEEYMEAFRTKSYIEMFKKVQGQLNHDRPSVTDKVSSSSSSSSLSSSSPSPPLSRLSEFLLEPRQETLADVFRNSNLRHHLLLDYFEASLEACEICESLLRCIHQTRANYRIIRRVIKVAKIVENWARNDHTLEFRELRSFALLRNPFSAAIGTMRFREIHDGHKALFRRLDSKSKMIRRKAKAIRIYKKAAGFGLVITYTAIATALLALIVHSIVGIVAAPGLVSGGALALKKRRGGKKGKGRRRRGGISGLESRRRRMGKQLDVAAKGVYILINDFDTMSRLVRRLHDQVEHGKAIAEICVKNGKGEVLKEVVKEFEAQEECFMEQLEELEEHIYLCFVNINRSRRLVLEEIMAPRG